MTTNSEIGRQLRADELLEKTVVVVSRVDRNSAMTMWVSAVGEDAVIFYGGATTPPISFMTLRRPDGTLVDDTETQILVYEYLGEV